jgi:ABC-2 type transport system permease protein
MAAIIRKELAEYFNSARFMMLFILLLGFSAWTVYSDQQLLATGAQNFVFLKLYYTAPKGISGQELAFFLIYINFLPLVFIPLVAVLLGFDAINKERNSGTLSRIISQPVYRDSVINGKFIASLIVLALMLGTSLVLIGGYGLRMIGVPPSSEEILRLFLYFFNMLIFGTFWIGLTMLFSIIFRNLATSMIFAVIIWLFFSFGIYLIARSFGDSDILNYSPNWMLGQALSVVMYPAIRTFGSISSNVLNYIVPNPLSLGQSLLVVWPYMVGLIALSAVCFAASYIVFMKQEIRST